MSNISGVESAEHKALPAIRPISGDKTQPAISAGDAPGLSGGQADSAITAPMTAPLSGINLIEKRQESGTLFAGQQKAQESDYDEGTVLREFMDYMKKTPAERWYEQFLKEEGLTKEELEALPPEERMKVEARIQERMEEVMKQGLGLENGDDIQDTAQMAVPQS